MNFKKKIGKMRKITFFILFVWSIFLLSFVSVYGVSNLTTDDIETNWDGTYNPSGTAKGIEFQVNYNVTLRNVTVRTVSVQTIYLYTDCNGVNVAGTLLKTGGDLGDSGVYDFDYNLSSGTIYCLVGLDSDNNYRVNNGFTPPYAFNKTNVYVTRQGHRDSGLFNNYNSTTAYFIQSIQTDRITLYINTTIYWYSYSTPILADSINSIILFINLSNINTTNVSVFLFYNNTNVSSSLINYVVNNVSVYNYTDYAPSLNNLNSNLIPINWSIYYNANLDTINLSQNVSILNIDNCSINTNLLFNFSVFNENNPSSLLFSDMLDYIITRIENGINRYNISGSFYNQTTYSFCIQNNGLPITYNVYIRYSALGGFIQRYYLYNQNYTNNPLNIFVGNYNSTASTTSVLNLNLKDTNYLAYPNLIIHLERFYVGTNTWTIVQWDKSDEYGRGLFNIREKDTDYRILIYNTNNILYKTTNTIKFFCGIGYCDLVQIIDPTTIIQESNLKVNYLYNNATQILTTTFIDNTSTITNFRIYVTQETFQKSIIICNSTISSSNGTINCNTNGFNGTIAVRIYSSASPEQPVSMYYFNKLSQQLSDVIGSKEGSFWAGMFLVVISSFGVIVSPIVGMALAIFGLIVLNLLGLITFITTTFIILVIIVAIILAIKVKT